MSFHGHRGQRQVGTDVGMVNHVLFLLLLIGMVPPSPWELVHYASCVLCV